MQRQIMRLGRVMLAPLSVFGIVFAAFASQATAGQGRIQSTFDSWSVLRGVCQSERVD
jgi:hypothetical protein